MKIYLAGGMKTGWQDKLIEHKKFEERHTFFDPRMNNTKEPREYATLDLHNIKQSDLVFAYLEKGNPSGAGLALEIGYGKGLGKTVIFVNEKRDDKYWKLVEETADVVFEKLEDGIRYLECFNQINPVKSVWR